MIGSPATGAQACAYGTNALRSFAQPSGLRTALTITIDWGLIAAAVLAAESSRSWWIYGLSVLVISRQFNALFELHHHAIHGNLFRIRHRNERFDWLYSVPLLIRVSEDRHEHMEHHRTFVIDDSYIWGTGYGLDPSRCSDRSYMIWFLLARPFVGVLQYDAFRSVLTNPGWKEPRFRRAVLIYWALVLAALSLAGRPEWILWYWLVPYFTLYQVLFFWDDMIGHYNCPLTGTRDMRGLWFRLMAVHGTGYHNVHHRHPKIPWFNQRRATRAFIDEESMDVARGFADAIRQMVVLCGGREETRPGTRPITRDKKSPVIREIGRQMP
jgi:fatty acid desaturase